MAGWERIGLERTRGELRLGFATREGRTFAKTAYQSGALRVRFPKPEPGHPLEAVLINTAGGLTGGDRLSVAVEMGEETHTVVTGQACEKIYRASGGEVSLRTDITLAGASALDWLPQPMILFDRAHLRRETAVDMSAAARLLLLEAGVLGRTAMNEEVREGSLVDSWRVRRGGRLVYADTLQLNGAIRERYGAPWALGAARAYATLLYVAPDAEQRLASLRGLLEDTQGRGAASAWNGLLVARFLAPHGHGLVKDLVTVLRGVPRGSLAASLVALRKGRM